MKKPLRVSKAVDALRLPASFIIECMADADGRPRLVEIDFHNYQHPSGSTICVAVFENEILAVTQEEANSGGWLRLGKNETMGIADVAKLWNYLRTSREETALPKQ